VDTKLDPREPDEASHHNGERPRQDPGALRVQQAGHQYGGGGEHDDGIGGMTGGKGPTVRDHQPHCFRRSLPLHHRLRQSYRDELSEPGREYCDHRENGNKSPPCEADHQDGDGQRRDPRAGPGHCLHQLVERGSSVVDEKGSDSSVHGRDCGPVFDALAAENQKSGQDRPCGEKHAGDAGRPALVKPGWRRDNARL
jgi:hypothetical protein